MNPLQNFVPLAYLFILFSYLNYRSSEKNAIMYNDDNKPFNSWKFFSQSLNNFLIL